jgi:hypothetical protein
MNQVRNGGPRLDCWAFQEAEAPFVWRDEWNANTSTGHEVPYYQPEASLEMFRRTLLNLDLAEGMLRITSNFSSTGEASATHTEPFVPLPTSTGASGTAGLVQIPKW